MKWLENEEIKTIFILFNERLSKLDAIVEQCMGVFLLLPFQLFKRNIFWDRRFIGLLLQVRRILLLMLNDSHWIKE